MSTASSNPAISKQREEDTENVSTAASAFTIQNYKMDHKARGEALIICNTEFGYNKLKPLHGYKKDAEDLKNVLQHLHFNVLDEYNASKSKILTLAEQFSKKDYTDSDCFVMVVLSHGDNGTVNGTDKPVDIEQDIVDYFKPQKCESLAYKPKIFIFQACRGETEDEGFTIAAGVSNTSQEQMTTSGEGTNLTIPSAADFLFCYSTTPGFVSWVSCTGGSVYIQELIKAVEELLLSPSCEPLEFLQVLTMVNRNVSKRAVIHKGEEKKQMPCFLSTLTKNLILSHNTKKYLPASTEQQETRAVAANEEKHHGGGGSQVFKDIQNSGAGASFGSQFAGGQNVYTGNASDNRRSKTVNIQGTTGTVNNNDGDVHMGK